MAKSLVEINAGLFRDGEYHAELELNQVSFPFTGRIEAQTPLKADFIGEVGMILVVDKWADGGAEVRPCTADDTNCSLFALNYSTELQYDERKPELRRFYQKRSTANYDWLGNGDSDDIYPRLGFLSVGDRFTTSAIDVAYDGTDFASDAKSFNGAYLKAGENGYWVKADDPENAIGPVVRVIDATIGMADKSYGFKVEVVKA
jgi:hypothetical protein